MATARKNGKTTGGSGGTRFKPGNPGRPKGALNRSTMVAASLLDGQAKALTQKCIELAMNGDTVALKLCMDRLIPPRKGRLNPVALPPVDTAAGAAAAMAAIVLAASEGRISWEDAQGMIAPLSAVARTFEIADMAAEISQLEELIKEMKR
jgi:hypothetical protein